MEKRVFIKEEKLAIIKEASIGENEEKATNYINEKLMELKITIDHE